MNITSMISCETIKCLIVLVTMCELGDNPGKANRGACTFVSAIK